MNGAISVERAAGERLDRVGIIASTACAVHCLAGGILAASAGALGIFADERVELGFVAFAITLAVVSIGSTFRRHRVRGPLVLVAIGVTVLVCARTVSAAELALSLTGAGFLVAAHAANLWALRCQKRCCRS